MWKISYTVHINGPRYEVIKRSYRYNSGELETKEEVIKVFSNLNQAINQAKELKRALGPGEALYPDQQTGGFSNA